MLDRGVNLKNSKLKVFWSRLRRKTKQRFFIKNRVEIQKKKFNFFNKFSNNHLTLSFNKKFNFFILQFLNNKNSFNQKNRIYSLFNFDNKNFNISIENNYYFFIFLYKNFLFYFFLPLTLINGSSFLYFNKNLSYFSAYNIIFLNFNDKLFNLSLNWFKGILKNSFNYVYVKFKYKGKNYRWHRKKKGIVLRFGHSHLIYSKKYFNVFLKKKGRMKMIFFGTNIVLIRLFLNNLIKWKPSNVYTGRGLRFSKQRLLKKAGKVSIYR